MRLPPWGPGLFLGALVGLVAWSGCGSSKEVPSASCSACAGATYTEADCKAAGEASGCESATLTTGGGACPTGCSFTNCDAPPTCGSRPGTPTPRGDAGRDPACDAAEPNGLFSQPPPSCAETTTVTINGATKYACKCGGACPCGYTCGSIALATGGTLGSVCAP